MYHIRIALSIVCWLLCAFFAYVALTVPMFGAAGPALFMIGFGVSGWMLWPDSKNLVLQRQGGQNEGELSKAPYDWTKEPQDI